MKLRRPVTWVRVGLALGLIHVIAACVSAPEIDKALPVEEAVDELLACYNVPAMAWAVVEDGAVVELGARGVTKAGGDELGAVVELGARGVTKAGGDEPVSVDSRFHIGSNTKAMTALLAGIAVDKGEIEWDATVGGLLPRGGYAVPGPYQKITLRELLSHTAGVPALPAQDRWLAYFSSGEPGPAQRRRMVEDTFELPPDFKPGSRTSYSNMGIVVAGAMLEVAAGDDWETLIRARLFEPLGMRRAGFGPPAADGAAGEPWGHAGDTVEPVDPASIGADNPPGLGPAGTVHASIADLAAYIGVWLDEGRPLVSRRSYDAIVAEVRDGFALGWFVYKNENGLVLTHDGSNTMFYSTMHLLPEKNIGVVVTANSGGAEKAVHMLAEHLLARVLHHE